MCAQPLETQVSIGVPQYEQTIRMKKPLLAAKLKQRDGVDGLAGLIGKGSCYWGVLQFTGERTQTERNFSKKTPRTIET